MKFLTATCTLLLSGAAVVNAHNVVTHFHVNGKAEQKCVNLPPNTNPITDLQSQEMACNAIKTAAKSKCAVKAGDSVAFEWRVDFNIPPAEYPLNPNGEPVGVTDVSHEGPCALYAKKVSNSLDDAYASAGDGWFKIAEDGLDQNGVFCSTRLRKANAPYKVTIPTTMAPGDYLLRAEMITLNNAGSYAIGGQEEPQFYVGCIAVTITGGDSSAKVQEVSIPGYLTKQSPGLIWDIWNGKDKAAGSFRVGSYPRVGPAPISEEESSDPSPSKGSPSGKPSGRPSGRPSKPTAPTPAPETPEPTYGPGDGSGDEEGDSPAESPRKPKHKQKQPPNVVVVTKTVYVDAPVETHYVTVGHDGRLFDRARVRRGAWRA
ncbi:glycosyl hydrolase family 61-domain-containing protein [Pyronema omphalodes]|nr:glycosyl hydrolase family 61-domain-containing protein [Pyronema omphalodes]